MSFVEQFCWILHIPNWSHLFVPWKSKHLVQVLHLTCRLCVIFCVKSIDLFLKHLSYRIVHIFNFIKFFLKLWFVRLLCVFQNTLVCMFEQVRLWPLFELICHLLDIIELFVNDTMQLFEVGNNLSASVNWILNFEIVCNHRSDWLIVFGKNSLKDREVVLSHFVSNLIKDVNKPGICWVLAHVESRRLKWFGHHVVSVQNLLGQDDENWVDLFIIQKPSILELKDFGHEQIFVALVILVGVLQQGKTVIIKEGHGLRKVGGGVVVQHFVPVVVIALDDCDVVFLYNFDFDSHCIFGIWIWILLKVNSNYLCDLLLVFFVRSQEVLNILVLGQWKLRVRKDRRIKLQSVHRLRLHVHLLFLWFLALCPFNSLGIFRLFFNLQKFSFHLCCVYFKLCSSSARRNWHRFIVRKWPLFCDFLWSTPCYFFLGLYWAWICFTITCSTVVVLGCKVSVLDKKSWVRSSLVDGQYRLSEMNHLDGSDRSLL